MAVEDQVLWRPSLALLLIVSFSSCSCSWSSAQDHNTSTNITITGVKFPLPSSCPTRCGNITFQYPFGIGHGCFRTGFDLTCSTATDPPKLFLANGSEAVIEVISDIDPSYFIVIKAPVAVMGVKDNSSNISWTPQANSPYVLEGYENSLWVIGCNATASLVDLTYNVTVATCVTTCPAAGGPDPGYNVTQETCKGIGCCYVNLHTDIESYSIKLYRLNQATKSNASSVKALVASSNGPTNNYLPSGDELMTVPVAYLWWKINDGLSSCNEANETNSYACLSQYSECSNYTDYYSISGNSRNVGYYCSCLTSQGNPYVPNGCYDSNSTALPGTDCATKLCGNISVPFPFGFEEGCFKDTWFALTCNETSNPPILLFSTNLQVNNITVEEGQIEFTSGINYGTFIHSAKPFGFLQDRAIFEWVIDYKTCEMAKQNTSDYACRSNHSTCFNRNVTTNYDQSVRAGYFCKCWDGLEGNPYLPDGCKDIDECQKKEIYVCYGICVNTFGSYNCTCPSGSTGDPTKEMCISGKKQGVVLGVIVGLCVGFGTLLLVVASLFATWKWKKIRQTRIRRRYFNQNHGLLLQQLIVSTEDVVEKTTIFTLEDLEKATNNFDSLRILGHGGHGTVYKGILADQRVVAIKRSKITMRSQIDEFINEVAILSQINHRNVVKLFGCCLETEVPLLVYEFISNGTLFDHLHRMGHKSTLSWKDRLRIALESAGALAYLHSSASISIFHRDMKSSNILLDEYFTAKVSDFGASRFIPLDQTHVFTAIQGTFGYLDPEYYRTCELTEKSDVYSFGVVLLELLTGEKPISRVHNKEEKILVIQFLAALKENRHFELMDARVIEEASREELDQVGKLAGMCLKLKGSERPTMKEVEIKLRFLSKNEPQRREKALVEANEEILPLLSDVVYYDESPSVVIQSSNHGTRNYSLEIEMIDSFGHPR